MPPPQTVIAGRYRLLRQLGAGGMGRVWLADDQMLGRHVAIKEVIIPADLSPDTHAETRLRTLREARTAARLNHPHVVKIYDVVHTEQQPWIVMEYVPSRSLQEVIDEEGALPPARVARIGLALLDALVAAHRAGVLHRDIKPANVLLAPDGRVVLTDFGLATFDGVDTSVTSPGLVLGSVRYVAPERARANSATPETDLWALGATLYAAVEGQPPYARYSTMETLAALASTLPDPPRHAGRLWPVLTGLLRRDPRDRLRPDEVRPLLERATLDGDRPVSPRQPKRLVVSVLAAAIVLLGAGGVLIAAPADRGPPPTTVQPLPNQSSTAATVDPVMGPACPATGAVDVVPASRAPTWPALLPGWVWYRDRGGFRIAVPDGWLAYPGRSGLCFREPGDTRWLGVLAWTPDGDPLTHVAGREASLLATAPPSGYQRVGATALPYYRGGADWEYTYVDDHGTRLHAIVRDFLVTPDRGYTIVWCTRDFDWQPNLDNFRLVTASFAPTT
jgi:hypothetical protein